MFFGQNLHCSLLNRSSVHEISEIECLNAGVIGHLWVGFLLSIKLQKSYVDYKMSQLLSSKWVKYCFWASNPFKVKDYCSLTIWSR